MRKSVAATIAIALIVSMSPVRSAAQGLDHLKCYKVRDSAKFKAEVDLLADQPQFATEKCKVKGKGALVCVPVEKNVTAFDDRTQPPLVVEEPLTPTTPVDGRICYKIKCDRRAIDDQALTDQFGTRVFSKLKPQMLCTPAAPVPAEVRTFDVVFHLDDAETLEALQFTVDYSGAAGEFDGSGSLECSELVQGIVLVSDDEGARELDVGLAAFPGVTGPADILACRYTSDQTPRPLVDFDITVTDATNSDEENVTDSVTVSIVSPIMLAE